MIRILSILTVGFFAALASGCDLRKGTESHDLSEERNEETFDTKSEENLAGFLADAIEAKYADIKLAELARKTPLGGAAKPLEFYRNFDLKRPA